MKNGIEAMITDITATTAEAEDYTGEDGLLYCGKCHTPKHGLKTGSLKVRTRITVVRVPAQIGKAVLLCIGFKDTLLIGNGIAFALQLVLMG